MQRLSIWSPRILSLLRIMTGALFLEHGAQKLLGFPPGGHLIPVTFTLEGLSGVFELVGGTLVAVGLFTRPAAFVVSGMMAVGYFTVHMPKNFYPVNNMGDAAVLFCFVFFYFVFAGPGPWSLDAMMRRDGEA